jgi:GTPase SAR1 family protein
MIADKWTAGVVWEAYHWSVDTNCDML